MAFKQTVKVEMANLTSVVRHVREFLTYLNTNKVKHLDWSVFQANDDWAKTFEETHNQGRTDM